MKENAIALVITTIVAGAITFAVYQGCSTDSCYLRSVLPNIIGGVAIFALTVPILFLTFSGNTITQVHSRINLLEATNRKNTLRFGNEWLSAKYSLIIENILESFYKTVILLKTWGILSAIYLIVATILPWFTGQLFSVVFYLAFTLYTIFKIYSALNEHKHVLLENFEGSDFETELEVKFIIEHLTEMKAQGYIYGHNTEIAVFHRKPEQVINSLNETLKNANHLLVQGQDSSPWHAIESINLSSEQSPFINVSWHTNVLLKREFIFDIMEELEYLMHLSDNNNRSYVLSAERLIARLYARTKLIEGNSHALLCIGYLSEYLTLLNPLLNFISSIPAEIEVSNWREDFPASSEISLYEYLTLLQAWASDCMSFVASVHTLTDSQTSQIRHIDYLLQNKHHALRQLHQVISLKSNIQ